MNEVPREDHRRFFVKYYADVFAGQTAADTLSAILPRVFTDRKCDRWAETASSGERCACRTNAVRVLQQFVEDRIIEVVQGVPAFRDDASLYR